ncbi:unnamed protein product [Nesidiocoris tenuis]|uniref:Uncharacterized protein n=1 Tax=Nesidiocoris tenuis TaxID=355587 RepID=A0A6H5HR80_9HEMI|nr:unnamed protein product [Nesidiocoris tenuis]
MIFGDYLELYKNYSNSQGKNRCLLKFTQLLNWQISSVRLICNHFKVPNSREEVKPLSRLRRLFVSDLSKNKTSTAFWGGRSFGNSQSPNNATHVNGGSVVRGVNFHRQKEIALNDKIVGRAVAAPASGRHHTTRAHRCFRRQAKNQRVTLSQGHPGHSKHPGKNVREPG